MSVVSCTLHVMSEVMCVQEWWECEWGKMEEICWLKPWQRWPGLEVHWQLYELLAWEENAGTWGAGGGPRFTQVLTKTSWRHTSAPHSSWWLCILDLHPFTVTYWPEIDERRKYWLWDTCSMAFKIHFGTCSSTVSNNYAFNELAYFCWGCRYFECTFLPTATWFCENTNTLE